MTTIKELINKYDAKIELNENIQEYDLKETYGLNIDNFKEYHQENRDGEKLHVFRGTFTNETPVYFEIIINKEDKEEDGQTTITYLAYPDDKYEEAGAVNQIAYSTNEDEDGITTIKTM